MLTWLLLPIFACPACGGESTDERNVGEIPREIQRSVETPAFVSQRPEFEALAERIFNSSSYLLSRDLARKMRRALENPELTGKARYQMRRNLAQRLLRDGEVSESIAIYADLLTVEKRGTRRWSELTRALGLAHLRQAEVNNCINRHAAACCIFPLAGEGLHTDTEPARQAFEHFKRFLEEKPKHLKTRWLLNIAAMALGIHPDGVPEEQRIPAELFRSEIEVRRFEDVAPRLGLDTFNLCGGAAVEDFDGDGLLDILTSTYDPTGPIAFYRNDGEGGFQDLSDASHASDQLGGFNLVAGDYDGDGDRDVLVLRGAWLMADGRLRNSLLRNDGGSFVDVTRAAGLADPARPTQAAAWGDFDNDGDLDLVVANESAVRTDPDQDFPTQLFRNNGDGTFTDVAAAAGVNNNLVGKGITVGDFDNDGDLDIYLSNFGPNRLYRNDGGLRFTDVAAELGVAQPTGRSFATWFFDYDNDGWLDIFVTSFVGSTAEYVADRLGMQRDHPRPRLYHNTGGTFEEVGAALGLDRFFLPMGANFGDMDSDGWLDIYLTTGDPYLESLMPNVMLRNAGGERFQDVTTSAGLGHLQKGHGVAFCDLDNDGDQDIYHQLGGFYPGDRFHNALFLNPGPAQHFLTIEPVGVRTNTDGIGARIAVHIATPDGPRVLQRAVGSVSSFGGSPRRQFIGLGDASAIEEVHIQWPGGGARQTFKNVPLDSFIRITESNDTYEHLAARPLRF